MSDENITTIPMPTIMMLENLFDQMNLTESLAISAHIFTQQIRRVQNAELEKEEKEDCLEQIRVGLGELGLKLDLSDG